MAPLGILGLLYAFLLFPFFVINVILTLETTVSVSVLPQRFYALLPGKVRTCVAANFKRSDLKDPLLIYELALSTGYSRKHSHFKVQIDYCFGVHKRQKGPV